jgi:hypothetical protein
MEEKESPRPTPRYRKVVDGSAGVARGMGHSYVGVEHLFLAIIRERGAVPTQVLGGLIAWTGSRPRCSGRWARPVIAAGRRAARSDAWA